MRAILLALLAACRPDNPAPADDAGPLHDAPPKLVGLAWSCDEAAASWSFTAVTEGWSGSAWLYLARSADDAERHPVDSVSAAADGSRDCLELDLDVVADWRDAVSGSSTRWRCEDADDLAFLIEVRAVGSDETADCATWGADPSVWAELDGAPDCDAPWSFDADTGDASDAAGPGASGGESCAG